MTSGDLYNKLCDDGYILHDVRAVGVGPAVCGWRAGRKCVREMLVVSWRESGVAGWLLKAELHEWEVTGRLWFPSDGIGGSLIVGHRVGRRESTFKHISWDRRQTYGRLWRQWIRGETWFTAVVAMLDNRQLSRRRQSVGRNPRGDRLFGNHRRRIFRLCRSRCQHEFKVQCSQPSTTISSCFRRCPAGNKTFRRPKSSRERHQKH